MPFFHNRQGKCEFEFKIVKHYWAFQPLRLNSTHFNSFVCCQFLFIQTMFNQTIGCQDAAISTSTKNPKLASTKCMSCQIDSTQCWWIVDGSLVLDAATSFLMFLIEPSSFPTFCMCIKHSYLHDHIWFSFWITIIMKQRPCIFSTSFSTSLALPFQQKMHWWLHCTVWEKEESVNGAFVTKVQFNAFKCHAEKQLILSLPWMSPNTS